MLVVRCSLLVHTYSKGNATHPALCTLHPALLSNIEPETQHIPILHHIFFTLEPKLSSFLHCLLIATAFNEIVERVALGPYETAGHVGVD